MKIFAIIPVHNRRETTLRMLESLQDVEIPSGVSLHVLVIDDGSTDGTSEAIAERFPSVAIEFSTGDLFWGGAVRLGIEKFLASASSHLWLLNDDLILTKSCLSTLVGFLISTNTWILSGTTLDDKGNIIYGGIIRLPFFRFRKMTETDFINGVCQAETVNGNCLFISRTALRSFDLPQISLYRQECFDMYLGLEATRLGHKPLVLRDAVCFASANTSKNWFYCNKFSLKKRLSGFLGPKGLPPSMYWDFCFRFSGPLAFLFFLRPFARVVFPKKCT